MNAPTPPTTRERRGTWPAAGWHVLAAAAFTLLATLNTAGYRYGVGDQAFYVPSILRQLDSRCFRGTARSWTGNRGCSCSTSCWPAPPA